MENITDFDFYLKFTKPLILNLPQIDDRVLAAAWVKKLTDSKEETLKLDYLKLLLFVLQRKTLAPPFTEHPNRIETLQKFPKNQTLIDAAKAIIERENNERRKKKQQKEGGDHPPYISDFSADLLEYVAVQNIDNFGAHAYYAVSKLPLNTWYRIDKQLLPKAAKSMLEISTPPPTLVETRSTPELVEPSPSPEKAGTPEQPPPPAEEAPPEPPIEEPPPPSPQKKKESPRKSTLGATPPSRPIGQISPPPEDREPPTWGSNLLEAKFLEEDVGDIATAAETIKEISPTEILWASPEPGGPGMLDDESPFLIGDEDMYYASTPSFRESSLAEIDTSMPSFLDSSLAGPMAEIDTSMPSFLDSSMAGPMTPPAWTSAASLPYMTPPYPGVTPPPPGKPTPPPLARRIVKKPPPKPRQTRASQLLQKKKAVEAAPPPPPPAKKPIRRPAPRMVKKPEPKPPQAKPPPKKGLIKKPSKVKKPAAAPAAPPVDEVDSYVAEYSRLMADMAEQYLADQEEREQPQPAAREGTQISKIARPKPKSRLSRIAKLSKQTIPKSHAVAVELDKSIHLSPEAREILQGVIEGPSTSTGITHPPLSPLRHPLPKMQHVEEVEEGEEAAPVFEEYEEAAGAAAPEVEYATTESSPGHSGKDPRLVAAFNQMLDSSRVISEEYEPASDLGGLDLEQLEMNLADISGGNLDAVMSGLEAAAQASDYDDFEEMERMIDEQVRREGAQTRPKKKLTKKQLKKGLKGHRDIQARADAQYEDLVAADATVLETVPAGDDFEALERQIEEEMRRTGEDPHARKRRISRKKLQDGRKRWLDLHSRTEAQMEELIAPDFARPKRERKPRLIPTVSGRSPLAEIREEDKADMVPVSQELDYDDFEAMERFAEEQMRREGAPAQPIRTLQEDPYGKDMKRFVGVFARAAAQYDDLVDGEASVLDAVPVDEAAERRIEEEMRPAGQDPHTRAIRRIAPDFVRPKPKPKIRRVPTVSGRSPLAQIKEEDEEDWVPGTEYFGVPQTRQLEKVDPRQKPAEFLFPGMEIPEDEDLGLLPDDYIEDEMPAGAALAFSPTSVQRRLQDRIKLYRDYQEGVPAYANVPVTVPRPTTTPERLPEAKGGPIPGLLAIPDVSPVDWEKVASLVPSEEDPYGLTQVERMWGLRHPAPISQAPAAPPVVLPASPPHTAEETRQIPTSPSQVAHYPEAYRLESPERAPPPVLAAAAAVTGAAAVSPPHKSWYGELEDLHETLFGPPGPQTEPTVFDVPTDKVYAESPPRDWAAPVSPKLSPPVDVAALKEAMVWKSIKPQQRVYRKRVGPKHVVNRYSHGPYWAKTIQEAENEPPAWMTVEDEDIRKEMERTQPVERRPIGFPYKHMRRLQRHSAPPALGAIRELYESPVKRQPDVFDLPEMHDRITGESPPPDFPQRPVSPLLSPEIDREALAAQIQAGYIPADRTRGIRGGVIKKRSKRPGLRSFSERIEEADEEDWEQRRRIEAAQIMPPKAFPKRRASALPAIGSPVEYPETSPTTTRPAAASPSGREGPRRRNVRKTLKKRRLDFSQPPSSPDETQVEVSEVQTEVGDREIYSPTKEFELPPEVRELIIRRKYGLPTSPSDLPPGSPRTPVQGIMNEEFPVVYLPEYSPPSPMSEPGVLERTMEEVKAYTHRGRKRPKKHKDRKARDFYKRYPWRKVDDIAEQPLDEATAIIHDEIEAEVERELAAQAAAERPPLTLLDEPVPGSLPSPLKPPVQVPFYESPVRYSPVSLRRPRSPEELKKLAIGLKRALEHQEMPDLYRSPEASPVSTLLAGPPISPGLAEEGLPEEFASPPPVSPPKTAEDVERIAAMQYAQLLSTPRKRPEGGNVTILKAEPLPAQMTAEQIQQMADAQYAALLSPTPPRRVSPARAPSPAQIQQIADAQYASLLSPTPPRGVSPTGPQRPLEELWAELAELSPSLGRSPHSPAARARSPSPAARARVATGLTPPNRPLAELEAELAALPPTPTRDQYSPSYQGMQYHSLISSPEVAKALAEARAAAAETAAVEAAARPQPEPVEFQYEETVQEHVPPKAVKPAAKIGKRIKGKAPDKKEAKPGARSVKSDKSIKPTRSDRSVRSSKSDKSVKSVESQGAIPKKPKKKIVSKIDTGRKKPKKEEPKPALVVQYDLPALEDLGLTEGDLLLMNLNDMDQVPGLEEEMPPELVAAGSPERPFNPIYPRRRVRPSRRAQPMPAVAETEEEYRPDPLGWDMRWHLSPRRRAELRAPDVKVMPSPLKDSRYKFEKISLDAPDVEPYPMPLPVARGHELALGPAALEQETMPEFMDDVFVDMLDDETVGARAEEAWEQLAGAEGSYDLSAEGAPGGIFVTDRMSPPPIRRRVPVGQPPVSPEGLRGELEMHEVYDPERERMTRKIRIGGKYIPLKNAQRPRLAPIYEGTPPKRILRGSPDAQQNMAAVMAAAQAQYDRLLEDRSPLRLEQSPNTLSPGELTRRVQEHTHDPKLYRKDYVPGGKRRRRMRAQRPRLEPIYEGTPPTQYDSLLEDSPSRKPRSPKTPSPGELRRRVQEHTRDPELYYKKWDRYKKRSPSVRTPPDEELEEFFDAYPEPTTPEDLYLERAPGYYSPIDVEEFHDAPGIDEEQRPPYYSPVSPLTQVEEQLDIWEGDEQVPPLSPIELVRTPEGFVADPKYREMLPSPRAPQRFQPTYYEPVHGIPEAGVFQSAAPPTPKKASVPKEQRKLPKRRLDFDAAPSPPPEEPMQVLTVETVERAVTPPPRSPREIEDEPEPSFLEVVSPDRTPMNQEEAEALIALIAEESPGPYGYSWGGQSPVPEDINEFKWMGQGWVSKKLPWDE